MRRISNRTRSRSRSRRPVSSIVYPESRVSFVHNVCPAMCNVSIYESLSCHAQCEWAATAQSSFSSESFFLPHSTATATATAMAAATTTANNSSTCHTSDCSNHSSFIISATDLLLAELNPKWTLDSYSTESVSGSSQSESLANLWTAATYINSNWFLFRFILLLSHWLVRFDGNFVFGSLLLFHCNYPELITHP